MLPKIWGKYAWNFIHLVTLSYPDNPTCEDKRQYYIFFTSLKNVLPCAKCKFNMEKHLKKFPLTDEILSSKQNLIKWAIDLHNVVNYYTGKTMLTHDEALNEIYNLTNPPKSNYYIYIIIIIIVLIILYLLIKN
uniref:thiol oxidase n=1 Tax=viral metagenome TaxID=1070528 RepID=A0A6C0LTZ9_9ZZZZ